VSNRLPMILESDTGLMIDSENTLGEDRLTAARRVSVIPHLVNTIVIGKRLRAVDQENINNLAASMATIGLRTPITVVVGGEDVRLVSGLHRLQAAKKLGWTSIDAFEVMVETDDTTIRLWEISENLHRVDLTVQERAEHIAEWVRLTGDKQGAQVAPPGGKQPHSKGIKAAVRDLGIDRTDAQRSMKIASIAPEAKEAARAAGLDDNQAALLEVARAPAAEQVQKVEEITRERSARQHRRAEGNQQPSADAAATASPGRCTEADMPLQLSAPRASGLVTAAGASEPTTHSGPVLTSQQIVDRQAMLDTSMDLFCIDERGELSPTRWESRSQRDEPVYEPVARFLGFHLGEWMHANLELIAVVGLAEVIKEKQRLFDACWCDPIQGEDTIPVFDRGDLYTERKARKIAGEAP
jgi:hypothetical protein